MVDRTLIRKGAFLMGGNCPGTKMADEDGHLIPLKQDVSCKEVTMEEISGRIAEAQKKIEALAAAIHGKPMRS